MIFSLFHDETISALQRFVEVVVQLEAVEVDYERVRAPQEIIWCYLRVVQLCPRFACHTRI